MQNKKQRAPKHKRRIIILLALGCFAAILVVGFFVYTGAYYRAQPSVWGAADAYAVTIEQKDGYVAIAPQKGLPTTGYIFYPGGKVEAAAYLPYLAQIAQQGYFCALLEAPFRLAVLDMGAAAKPIEENPGISAWAVGGHSLGGVAAASFAGENRNAVQGLVLLAAYPGKDLSSSGLRVTSITATEDRILNWENYERARQKLPGGTLYVSMEGGNHGQFGAYGPQKRDGPATLPPDAQQEQTATATIDLLMQL